jgi:hypothetical protein
MSGMAGCGLPVNQRGRLAAEVFGLGGELLAELQPRRKTYLGTPNIKGPVGNRSLDVMPDGHALLINTSTRRS